MLHKSQYGFRRGKSTIDALEKVLSIQKEKKKKSYKNRKLALLILLDVENAFNSAPWKEIVRTIMNSTLSEYLKRILNSYLENRFIMSSAGEKLMVTCGVPQGSVLRPTIWNILYDQVLRVEITQYEAEMIAYADDLAVVVQQRGRTKKKRRDSNKENS